MSLASFSAHEPFEFFVMFSHALTYIRRMDLLSPAAGLVILLAARLVTGLALFGTRERVEPK